MAFTVSQSGTYRWPVTIDIPVDDGKFKKETFQAIFKRLKTKEIIKMRDDIQQGSVLDADIVKLVLAGWAEVFEENVEIPFNEENLEKALELPGFSGAIAIAFFESFDGAKRKN